MDGRRPVYLDLMSNTYGCLGASEEGGSYAPSAVKGSCGKQGLPGGAARCCYLELLAALTVGPTAICFRHGADWRLLVSHGSRSLSTGDRVVMCNHYLSFIANSLSSRLHLPHCDHLSYHCPHVGYDGNPSRLGNPFTSTFDELNDLSVLDLSSVELLSELASKGRKQCGRRCPCSCALRGFSMLRSSNLGVHQRAGIGAVSTPEPPRMPVAAAEMKTSVSQFCRPYALVTVAFELFQPYF